MADLKITTLEVSLGSVIPPSEQQTEITKYQAPKKDKPKRKYEAKERIVYGPYLEELFLENELEAYITAPLTDKELKYKFLNEYKRNYQLKQRFRKSKETIGNLRNHYNRGKLHAAQEPVYFLSFSYGDNGDIVVDGRQYYKPLRFSQAYDRCIQFQVADPRFIDPDKIILIRDRINSEDPAWEGWSVPPDSWIQSMQNRIGRELYNSVHFPPFHGLKDETR